MTTLEQVTQLRQQGMTDDQIVDNLQQQGVSPKEITDSINQANIKNAVTGENPNAVGGAPVPGEEVAPNPNQMPADAGTVGGGYNQSNQQMPTAGGYDQGGYAGGGYADPNAAAGYGGGYDQGGYAGGGGYGDSSVMIEIANQVFTDKAKKMQDQVDDLNEFKVVNKAKVDGIDERLKKIEKLIDTLQIKILEKVSSFGKDIESTKKEIAMVEDTVGKITKGMGAKKTAKTAKPSSQTKPKKSVKKK